MLHIDDHVFKRNDDYYESIGKGMWLMDNHKWSFVVWNKERNRNISYLLVHIDYHWDAVYDYWSLPEEEKVFFAANESEIISIVQEENLIRYDSFICPAIAKGFIDEVHFYCLQGDENGDAAIYEKFLEKYSCTQVLHKNTNSLSQLETEKPIIFDFCIDIFNSSNKCYESQIWPEERIDNLLLDCMPLVSRAKIVTISMSYGFSGSCDDTERLTKKVVNLFASWREDS